MGWAKLNGERLAKRWPRYLNKHAEKEAPSIICVEVAAILGHGVSPPWLRRQDLMAEEKTFWKGSCLGGGMLPVVTFARGRT